MKTKIYWQILGFLLILTRRVPLPHSAEHSDHSDHWILQGSIEQGNFFIAFPGQPFGLFPYLKMKFKRIYIFHKDFYTLFKLYILSLNIMPFMIYLGPGVSTGPLKKSHSTSTCYISFDHIIFPIKPNTRWFYFWPWGPFSINCQRRNGCHDTCALYWHQKTIL